MNSLLSILLILSSIFYSSSFAPSQVTDSSDAEVEETVIEFFNAMRKSDSSAMKSYLTPDVTLHTVIVSEEGNAVLRQTGIPAFINSVNQSTPGSLDEQLTSFIAHVDGNLSTAWMGYSFYYDGEFSHCGVNTMNLIQTEDGWKIFSIVDTRRQEGC